MSATNQRTTLIRKSQMKQYTLFSVPDGLKAREQDYIKELVWQDARNVAPSLTGYECQTEEMTFQKLRSYNV